MSLVLGLLFLLAGLMAYVRLAPSDPALWHIDLVTHRPAALGPARATPGGDDLKVLRNGAYVDLALAPAEAAAALTRLDAIASQSPRSQRLAGSPAEGHVTWISRSAFWGFPDYTTAQITPFGLTLYARQRFGGSDLGVNAARLRDWLARL